jgi:hypothetical protein
MIKKSVKSKRSKSHTYAPLKVPKCEIWKGLQVDQVLGETDDLIKIAANKTSADNIAGSILCFVT